MLAISPTNPFSSASQPAPPVSMLGCLRQAVAPCPATNSQPQFTSNTISYLGTYRRKH
jgi:hypothetical protein